MFRNSLMSTLDKEIAAAIQAEYARQEDHIELIASENYASRYVMEAQGSILTNKYAEGYPHKRYYGGCQYVDVIEEIAIARAKQLFGASYVNVQPHSGSQANAAVYLALLKPGDTVLGMSLNDGGHLTHGAKVNFSGKFYHSVCYGVNAQTGYIDYEQVAQLAREHKPQMIMTGFSAHSRILDWARFRAIADEVGAYLVADIAHVAGLVATGLYPSPLQFADVVTTTTHKTLRGPRGGMIMARENPEIHKKLNSAVFPGLQGGPLMHVIAAKAVAFLEALQPEFKTYQQNVLSNAQEMVKVLQSRGYSIVSGGTDNHLFLIDLAHRSLTGQEAEILLDQIHITTNKNTLPNEQRSPQITSGIRIGTPAITTRGFTATEAKHLAGWICDALDKPEDHQMLAEIKSKVLEMCKLFPVYSP